MPTITIRDHNRYPAIDYCNCWMTPGGDGPNYVPHIAQDHALIGHRRITGRRCSVCDQEWGDGAVSRHEYCDFLYEDGTRRYADCLVYLDGGDLLVVAS